MSYLKSRRGWRITVAIAAASVLATGLAVPANAAETATLWDTYSSWDGTSTVSPFGNPDTASYGQTFTAPSGTKKLKKFTFFMASAGVSGDLVVRGELYGWDAATQRATTPIWESKATTISVDADDPAFSGTTFKPRKKGKIKPGQTYIMFLSVSKDYEASTPDAVTRWAAQLSDVLPGGNVVYLNNGGDESAWTTAPWSAMSGFDFALKAKLK